MNRLSNVAMRRSVSPCVRLSVHRSVRRRFSAETTALAKTVEQPKVVKKGPTITQRLTAFVFGASVSLALGYYQLQVCSRIMNLFHLKLFQKADIKHSTENIEQTLHDLRRDTVESQKLLRSKISNMD